MKKKVVLYTIPESKLCNYCLFGRFIVESDMDEIDDYPFRYDYICVKNITDNNGEICIGFTNKFNKE